MAKDQGPRTARRKRTELQGPTAALPVALQRLLAILVLMSPAAARSPPSSLDDEARRYVRLAVALGERDPDSLDFYAGPDGAVADMRRNPPPLTAIGREAGELARAVSADTFGPADAIRAAGAVGGPRGDRGSRRSADRSAAAISTGERGLLRHRAPRPIEARARGDPRADRGSDRAGGRLVDRYATFAARFTVPPDRLAGGDARGRRRVPAPTVAHVALPPGEQAPLEFVRDKPWGAFSRYLGGARSVIQINTDFRFTVDQALQIACHEGYPGHHTRNTLRAPSRDAADGPPGALGATDVLARGARVRSGGDAGGRRRVPAGGAGARRARAYFRWPAWTAPARRRHIEVERLAGDLQIVQAEVARRYLDGELEFTRAVTVLEERALVPHAEALIKYINEYRSYVTTYTAGKALVSSRVEACAGPRPADEIRWRCFKSET